MESKLNKKSIPIAILLIFAVCGVALALGLTSSTFVTDAADEAPWYEGITDPASPSSTVNVSQANFVAQWGIANESGKNTALRLTQDVTLSAQLSGLVSGAVITIDLNNCVLNLNVSRIYTNGILIIKDSAVNRTAHTIRTEVDGEMTSFSVIGGVVTSNHVGRAINVDALNSSGSARFYMQSGTIAGCSYGAVQLANLSYGKMTGGTITNNKVTEGSGVGVNVLSNSYFEMTGGVISNNRTGAGNGGGVTVSGANFSMTGGEIKNNEALTDSTTDLTGQHKGRAGGLEVGGGSIVHVSGGVISGNTSDSLGGGVFVHTRAKFILSGTARIARNTTYHKGGGIGIRSYAQVEMNGGEIIDNTSIKGYVSSTGTGGGVVVDGAAFFSMTDGRISGNASATSGGGVHINGAIPEEGDKCGFVMSGGSISNNSTEGSGGGIYGAGGISTFEITGGEIYGNKMTKGTGYGGGIFVTGSPLTLSGCKIHDNVSPATGGGLYLTSSTVTITDCEIYGNTAATNGGGMYVNSGTVTFGSNNHTSIGGNFANKGAGVYVNNATVNMMGGNINEGNVAEVDGGGLYVAGGHFNFFGGEISDNVSKNEGGGVYAYGGTFTMNGDDALISGNVAAVNGGGVFAMARFVLIAGTITDNTATSGFGGGVVASGSKGVVARDDDNTEGTIIISDNVAGTYGGGIYVTGGSFTMTDGYSVLGNSALRGGGIWLNTGTFNMDGGEVTGGNYCTMNGGGVNIHGGTFTMRGGVISDNVADNDGGGVYAVNGGVFNMEPGTLITSNTATNNGGGINVSGGGTNATIKGIVTDNTAVNGFGGGVNFASGILKLEGAPKILSNTMGVDGENVSNLYFSGTSKVTLVGTIGGEGIGVATDTNGILTTGDPMDDIGVFFSDDTTKCLGLTGNELRIDTHEYTLLHTSATHHWRKCANCGDEDDPDKSEHNNKLEENIFPEVAAICTKSTVIGEVGVRGVRQYSYCPDCGLYFDDETEEIIDDLETWKSGKGAIEPASVWVDENGELVSESFGTPIVCKNCGSLHDDQRILLNARMTAVKDSLQEKIDELEGKKSNETITKKEQLFLNDLRDVMVEIDATYKLYATVIGYEVSIDALKRLEAALKNGEVLTSEELSAKKEQAQASIDAAVAEAKAEIDGRISAMTNGLTKLEARNVKMIVDAEATRAKTEIDQATTTAEVDDVLNSAVGDSKNGTIYTLGKLKADSIALAKVKENATQRLYEAAAKITAAVKTGNISFSDRTGISNALNGLLNSAFSQLAAITDESEGDITSKTNEVKKILGDTKSNIYSLMGLGQELEDEKDDGKDTVDNTVSAEVNTVLERIDNGKTNSLTEQEAEELLALIDKEASRMKSEIDMTESILDAHAATGRGISNVRTLASGSVATARAKDEAKEKVEILVYDNKHRIDQLKDLSAALGVVRKQEIDQIAKRYTSEIDAIVDRTVTDIERRIIPNLIAALSDLFTLEQYRQNAKDAIVDRADKLIEEVRTREGLLSNERYNLEEEINRAVQEAFNRIDTAASVGNTYVTEVIDDIVTYYIGVEDDDKYAGGELEKIAYTKETMLENVKNTARLAIQEKVARLRRGIDTWADEMGFITGDRKDVWSERLEVLIKETMDAIDAATDIATIENFLTDALIVKLNTFENIINAAAKSIEIIQSALSLALERLADWNGLTNEQKEKFRTKWNSDATNYSANVRQYADVAYADIDEQYVPIQDIFDEAESGKSKIEADKFVAQLIHEKNLRIGIELQDALDEIRMHGYLTDAETNGFVDKINEYATKALGIIDDADDAENPVDEINTAYDEFYDLRVALLALAEAKCDNNGYVDSGFENNVATLDSLEALTTKGYNTYMSQLEAARDLAMSKIYAASDVLEVVSAYEECRASYAATIAQAKEKNNDNVTIDTAAREAKDKIASLENLTPEQREKKQKEIDAMAEKAKDDIYDANLGIGDKTAEQIRDEVLGPMDGYGGKRSGGTIDKLVALEIEKNVANGEIDRAVTSAKRLIAALIELSEDARADKDHDIDEMARLAKERIEALESDGGINAILDEILGEVTGDSRTGGTLGAYVELEQEKDRAKQEITEAVTKAKEAIGELEELDEDLVADKEREIEDIANRAKDNIDKAGDFDAIGEILDGVLGIFDDDKRVGGELNEYVDLEREKDEAKKEISEAVVTAKEAISALNELSGEQKEEKYAEIDELVRNVRWEINGAVDSESITALLDGFLGVIDGEARVGGELNAYVELEKRKNEAKAEISKAVTAAKNVIGGLSELSNEQKNAKYAEIDAMAQEAKSNIDNSLNNIDVSNVLDVILGEEDSQGNRSDGSLDEYVNFEIVRNDGKKEINDATARAKLAVDTRTMNGELEIAEGDQLKDIIDQEAQKAKNELDEALDSATVTSIVNRVCGKLSADGTRTGGDLADMVDMDGDEVVIEHARREANAAIDSAVQAAESKIHGRVGGDLTYEQGEMLIYFIEKEASRAKSEISRALSQEEIDTVLDRVLGVETDGVRSGGKIDKLSSIKVDNISLEQRKQQAKDEIDSAVEAAKKTIDTRVAYGELTAQQASELKKLIDREAERARKEVENAAGKDAISVILDRVIGEEDIGCRTGGRIYIIAATVADKVDLEKKKQDAKDEIDRRASEKKSQVDEMNWDGAISADEALARKTAIEKEAKDAKEAIDNAQSDSQLEDVKKAGLSAIDFAANPKVDSGLEIGKVIVMVAAVMALIILLSIVFALLKR